MERRGHITLRAPRRFFGQSFHRQGASLGLCHRRSHALEHSEEDELSDVLRKPAEKRADRRYDQAETEERVAAVDIADAPEDQRQTDLGNLISDHRPGNADDGGLQTIGNGRQRNGKDSAGGACEEIAERRVGEQQPIDLRGCHSQRSSTI